VANRSATGREPLGLCPVCGRTFANLGGHVKSHANVDKERVMTYAKAEFTRGMRGPIFVPTVRQQILEAGSDPAKIDSVIKNLMTAVGIGSAESERSALPRGGDFGSAVLSGA